jgi:hypothetical protein
MRARVSERERENNSPKHKRTRSFVARRLSFEQDEKGKGKEEINPWRLKERLQLQQKQQQQERKRMAK